MGMQKILAKIRPNEEKILEYEINITVYDIGNHIRNLEGSTRWRMNLTEYLPWYGTPPAPAQTGLAMLDCAGAGSLSAARACSSVQ